MKYIKVKFKSKKGDCFEAMIPLSDNVSSKKSIEEKSDWSTISEAFRIIFKWIFKFRKFIALLLFLLFPLICR